VTRLQGRTIETEGLPEYGQGLKGAEPALAGDEDAAFSQHERVHQAYTLDRGDQLPESRIVEGLALPSFRDFDRFERENLHSFDSFVRFNVLSSSVCSRRSLFQYTFRHLLEQNRFHAVSLLYVI
jgi:hypothetical protein